MMQTMDGNRIARWRMSNLRLSSPPLKTPEEVVRWLCAVQSQDYGPAKWSIAERTQGIDDAAMDRAFNDGAILRTHVLRPTWHFVLPEDIRWVLEATGPRVQALNAYMYRQEELDKTILNRSSELIARTLEGGVHLTRQEVGGVLERAGIVASRFRLAYILMNAELNAIVCSGPLKGKQHTYALVDERAPQAKSLGYDEALAELTLRYYAGHGPATVKDLKSWSSLTAADVGKGLEMVGPQLEHEVIDGLTYWYAGSPQKHKIRSPTVHLLQAYDEYIMGYSESRHVLDIARVAELPRQGSAAFNHVVTLDGQLAGHWKRTLKKNSVKIEVALYRPFTADQIRALQAAVDAHGAYLGVTPAPVSTMAM